MRLIRIDHASLNTGDRAATLRWYDEVLGLRRAHPDAPAVAEEPMFLGADGAQVALFADRAPGLRHVALATDAEGFAEVRAALEARGCAFKEERHTAHDSIYVDDPDGNTLEVMIAPELGGFAG
ncbi:VOC family protein [Conexibacter woesei]|uniref:VOC family protein n=1 Tax=Conexibacter woesei TaxID=191495 RepID=UPI0003FFEFB2|nr:VOC family protein [Conexibacter woesei]